MSVGTVQIPPGNRDARTLHQGLDYIEVGEQKILYTLQWFFQVDILKMLKRGKDQARAGVKVGVYGGTPPSNNSSTMAANETMQTHIKLSWQDWQVCVCTVKINKYFKYCNG